jgi:DNA-binding LacI/PurR family transcriptional regulator
MDAPNSFSMQPENSAPTAARAARKPRARRERNTPSIREVAAQAGVSIATVSNVLDGKNTLFTPQTAERVLEAARTLGYKRNSVARSLVRRRTSTLGLVAYWRAHTTGNSFFSNFVFGFIDGAADFNYQVKIIRLNEDQPDETLRHLEDGSIDGAVLLSPRCDSALVAKAGSLNLPLILAGYLSPDAGLPCVGLDDVKATRDATAYLIARGHRDIALLGGDPERPVAALREKGYREALQNAHLTFNPQWSVVMEEVEKTPLVVESIMSTHPRPTAFICYNDWQARDVIAKLQSLGLRVPADVSVIGFNDDYSEFMQPPITTVSHPIVEIGSRSAQLLAQRIEARNHGENTPTDNVQVPFHGHIIERESVASVM